MWGCSHIETKFDGKFNSHEAILNDYPNIGDAIWGRFTEGTIWYYRKLSTIFNEVLPGRLARELSLWRYPFFRLSKKRTHYNKTRQSRLVI
jgi:hypothetical protein